MPYSVDPIGPAEDNDENYVEDWERRIQILRNEGYTEQQIYEWARAMFPNVNRDYKGPGSEVGPPEPAPPKDSTPDEPTSSDRTGGDNPENPFAPHYTGDPTRWPNHPLSSENVAAEGRRFDALFPGTTPWERLGSGGGASPGALGGVAGAGSSREQQREHNKSQERNVDEQNKYRKYDTQTQALSERYKADQQLQGAQLQAEASRYSADQSLEGERIRADASVRSAQTMAAATKHGSNRSFFGNLFGTAASSVLGWKGLAVQEGLGRLGIGAGKQNAYMSAIAQLAGSGPGSYVPGSHYLARLANVMSGGSVRSSTSFGGDLTTGLFGSAGARQDFQAQTGRMGAQASGQQAQAALAQAGVSVDRLGFEMHKFLNSGYITGELRGMLSGLTSHINNTIGTNASNTDVANTLLSILAGAGVSLSAPQRARFLSELSGQGFFKMPFKFVFPIRRRPPRKPMYQP